MSNDDAREQIMNENNNAQNMLIGLLNQIHSTNIDELQINDVLHGDLDFSILEDRGFKNVKKIVIDREGEVTNIFNIPTTITTLICKNQMLNSIEKLPTTIEILDLSDNKISKFNSESLVKLKELNISNNELTELKNLPESLEKLECANNQLRELDLARTPQLKILICSNNPILILQHVPPSLDKIEMENNPFVEIHNDDDDDEENKKKSKKKLDYLESLNDYLKLKNDYETKLRKMKKSAFEKGITIKDAKIRANSVKIPCIYCKEKVGTNFYIEDNYYRAICGSKTKQCDLNIKLYKGEYMSMDYILNTYFDDMQEDKQEIILNKMDSIFKFLSDENASKLFEKNLERYNQTSELYKEVLHDYDEIYNNFEKSKQIDRKMEQIFQIRENIKKLTDEFKKTGNRKILISASEMYNRDLLPAFENLRILKYGHMFVETDDNDVSRLIQLPVPVQSKDYIYGEQPKVVSFVSPTNL